FEVGVGQHIIGQVSCYGSNGSAHGLLVLLRIAAKDSGWNHAKKGFFSRNSGENVEEWHKKRRRWASFLVVLAANGQY
ncbi:MAG: hypothetical protein ACPHSF_08270, partial [Flavobacteriales bacterium]